jgi:hypothetical protein
MRVVFSQPMYLPWQGLFDQLRHADIFIHYDDAQFTKGGFLNRVQMKTPEGFSWLSVPVLYHLGDTMRSTRLDATQRWQEKHLTALRQTLSGLPYAHAAIDALEPTVRAPYDSLAELNIALFEQLAGMMQLRARFMRSSQWQIESTASEKVLHVLQHVGATTYITGHGARNYLDHALLESHGIATEYIDYALPPYPQKFGAFNPYVTVLTLLAAVGQTQAVDYLNSRTLPWRQCVDVT